MQPQATTPTPSKRRRRAKRVMVTVAVLAALGAAGYYVAERTLMGPAVGTVLTQIPVSQNTAPPVELEQFDGVHLTFARPVAYKMQTQKQADKSSLETHTFIASGMVSKILTVTVTNLPTGQVADDTSYHMRTLHPERYKMSELLVKGEKVMLAENKGEYQRTAFWAHGNKLLTFSVSGISSDTAAVTAEYQQMLESVTWR